MRRPPQQAHVGAKRRPAGLSEIARTAGRHQVVPPPPPAQSPRLHVVDGHIRTAHPAVLTGVRVSYQHLATAQFDRGSRAPYVIPKSNDTGPRHLASRRPQRALVVRQRLGLALGQQHDGAPHAADVERLVVLIQEQNRRVHKPPARRG